MALKIIGCLLIFSSCALCGISVSGKFYKRKKVLNEISIGLDKAACRLKRGGADRKRIIEESFKDVITTDKNGEISISQAGINLDDKKILDSYFSAFGKENTEKELKNLELTASLIKIQYESAVKEAEKNASLFKTLGFCAGLLLCILFI